MLDPEVHEILETTIANFPDVDCDSASLASALIGALAVSGFAIVQVDAEVMRRVLADMAKEEQRGR